MEVQGHPVQSVLQAALEGCDLALLVMDPSHPDFPIIGVSKGMSELTTYHGKELLGNSCRLLSFQCGNDPVNIARLRSARIRGVSFETVLINRKKSGPLFRVLVVLRRITVGNTMPTNENCGFLLAVQIELPCCDDEDDDLVFLPPELVAQTKDTADKLASCLSQLLQEDQDSPCVDPQDACTKQCSILHGSWELGLAKAEVGLAPLLLYPSVLARWQHAPATSNSGVAADLDLDLDC